MKKVLALFILTCLLIASLCGCSAGANGKSAYELAVEYLARTLMETMEAIRNPKYYKGRAQKKEEENERGAV